jgi:hypothetical protein
VGGFDIGVGSVNGRNGSQRGRQSDGAGVRGPSGRVTRATWARSQLAIPDSGLSGPMRALPHAALSNTAAAQPPARAITGPDAS